MCRNPGGALALWTGFPELPLLFLALTGGVSTLAFFAARRVNVADAPGAHCRRLLRAREPIPYAVAVLTGTLWAELFHGGSIG